MKGAQSCTNRVLVVKEIAQKSNRLQQNYTEVQTKQIGPGVGVSFKTIDSDSSPYHWWNAKPVSQAASLYACANKSRQVIPAASLRLVSPGAANSWYNPIFFFKKLTTFSFWHRPLKRCRPVTTSLVTTPTSFFFQSTLPIRPQKN